ncbi:MAG: hypothetical protein FJ108_01040 [Deltaproteobacteria bacterium]|nr:hypothetical protein [Deltaproteobacteria bacterium]
MLSKFDDYPIHQTSEPIAVPAATDRNAYDRYWFNGYTDDGEFYFGVAAALYPNLGIMDCAFSIVRDGEQHAFHASRRAPREPSAVEVGPFRIEIIEPLRALRVVLAPNETGISADLLWIPRTSSFSEGQQRQRRRRGTMDATRFNQFGKWKGEIRYAGRRLAIEPSRVYGTKDRSWGVRPVGSPDPGGAPPSPGEPGGIFFLWAPLHWKHRCTHAGIFETNQGVRWHWNGSTVPVYDDPAQIPLVDDPGHAPLLAVDHQIEYAPGTRRASRALITKVELDGTRNEIELLPLTCFRMKGIGYQHPVWGHGMWRGELAIGGESWKCSDLDENALENQHIQQVMRARCGSDVGVGVLEQICIGPFPKYGLTGFLDPA